MSLVAEYKLGNDDCNKQPRVQCGLLKEQLTFEGNVSPRCPGLTLFWFLDLGINIHFDCLHFSKM